MTPGNLDVRTASLHAFAFPAPARFRGRPQLLTRPCPSRRGTWLAWAAAVTTANANGEADTITFETAGSTLTAVDNNADAPNARQNPCDNPEAGQLRCPPSGSHEPAVWATGGPAIKASGGCVRTRLEPVEWR
jgi:hypothetical protein